MISPMPFWPSFEPCAKLTPVHVKISRPRIHHGGGALPFGSAYSSGFFTSSFNTSSNAADAKKPISGDSSSDQPILPACDQSTPLVPLVAENSWLPSPTPITEPISVCELDAGRPSAQVPRFQMMAAISSAKTIAKPAPEPTCRISSTGSSVMMLYATAPLDSSTPRKLNAPDHTTARVGGSECV